MRMPDLFRSSALRLALSFAIAMTVATSIIFGFVYLQITASDESRLRLLLIDEAAKGTTYTDAELRNALDLRLTRDLRRLDYVALFDTKGKMLLGNVLEMPPIPVDGNAHFVAEARPPGGQDRSEPAIFVARLRPDGGVLLLGRSLLEDYALRKTVLLALVIALAPMLLFALGIGAFFARRTGRRLTLIHRTTARIIQGDLHVRLPVRIRPDEIDRISRDVNLMLDEIVRLLVQVKSVSDNIAHDLRTPLAVVRAKLERGLSSPDDREFRLAIQQALVELDKAMRTITALLRISEVESASRSSAFGPIDLSAICADLFEFYEPLARAKSITMTLDANSPVRTVGDSDLMREAVSNLIDNAVKFTPEGGSVHVCATTEADRALIRISDSGSGVEPGERNKIFDRFYRTIRDDRVPGSGLGLNVAAAIAKLHDFDLTVEDNQPGALFEMCARRKPFESNSSPIED